MPNLKEMYVLKAALGIAVKSPQHFEVFTKRGEDLKRIARPKG